MTTAWSRICFVGIVTLSNDRRERSAICRLIKAAGILLRDLAGVSLPVLP